MLSASVLKRGTRKEIVSTVHFNFEWNFFDTGTRKSLPSSVLQQMNHVLFTICFFGFFFARKHKTFVQKKKRKKARKQVECMIVGNACVPSSLGA